ncbi:hypothetical protein GY45DRAFT_158681 [Cubamyces sp. BRFM 1775]|nr:hypothetical protein GY45DRAFT_158681 [Cubamyces sp. BRFM 1775]
MHTDISLESTYWQSADYGELRRSGPWTVPLPDVYLSRKENSAQTYGFDPKDAKSRYLRLGKDAVHVTAGPMPLRDFLEAFLPVQQDVMERMPTPSRGTFSGIKAKNKHEADIYKILLRGLNANHTSKRATARHPSRCPGYVFRDTSARADDLQGKVGSVKPDILCYAERYLPMVGVRDGNNTDQWASVTRIGFAETFIEVKADQSQDHYHDPSPDADLSCHKFVLGEDVDSASQCHDLGQNVAYATDMCSRQHRRFCFSVSVSGSTARLIRWDRSGAIVTQSFNYVTKPELLCEFFWRFAHLSDEERGYDMSVTPANKTDERLFAQAIEKHIRSQIDCSQPEVLTEHMDTHYMPGYVSVVTLSHDPEHPSPVRRLLVSRPVAIPLSFSGRCSRVYWAVDPDRKAERKVVLLKDTWRLHGRGADVEGKVITELHEKAIPNIPSVLYHGDVSIGMRNGRRVIDHTLTSTFVQSPSAWLCEQPRLHVEVASRIHYRLVLDVAGFPLLSLYGTHELLHSTYDAFRALVAAYDVAKRVHRDVHPGNIILYNNADNPSNPRTGYLVDWDLSCTIQSKHHTEDLYRPSYQWQFVSLDVLDTHQAKLSHDIVHDMESMLYVVLYCGLTRLPHDVPANASDFRQIMQNMFDISTTFCDREFGGEGKRTNSINRLYTDSIVWKRPELKRWINAVCDLHHPRRGSAPEMEGKWTVEELDRFWSNFLQENSDNMEKDDCQDNVLKHGGLSGYAPMSVQKKPWQPTISPAKKRGGRPAKRVKLQTPESTAGPSTVRTSKTRSARRLQSSTRSLRTPFSFATAPPPTSPALSTAPDIDASDTDTVRGRSSPAAYDRFSPAVDDHAAPGVDGSEPIAGPSSIATTTPTTTLRRSTRKRKASDMS